MTPFQLLTLKNCNILIYFRLTGEEEQIGGFDIIYNKAKSVKQGSKNFSFLGCLNNRHQQMRKMAKTVALRLAD
jgi:hypothetical protein